MSNCPRRDELSDFVNRTMSEDRLEIEAHVAECADCQRVIDELPRERVPAIVRPWSSPIESTLDATFDDLSETLTAPSAASGAASPLRLTLPGYEILDELGRGGMGVVFKARQVSLNRLIALKMIRSTSLADDQQMARFKLEAESLAQLQHPNIVQVFENGQYQDMPYLAMEYVPGVTLAREIESQQYSPHRAAALVEKLARAMYSAHQRGVLHRDLKPSNVLFAADGEPKITDFGLAKRVGDESHLTLDRTVMGTPSYMPPEQALGNIPAIGPRSDIYSLGAILYELLTGRPPFRGSTALETIQHVAEREPSAPRTINPRIPRDLETICLKCLHKKPEGRFETAADLADDLRRFQRDEPILARRIGRLARGWRWCRRNPALSSAMALTVLAVLSGTFGVAWQSRETERARSLAQQQFERYTAESSEKLNLIQDLMERVPEDQRAQDQRLQTAVAAYESWLEDEPSSELAQASYADALFRIAEIRRRIGQFDRAEEMFHKARQRYEQMAAATPSSTAHIGKLAEILTSLGETYREKGDLRQAIEAYGESLHYYNQLASQSSTALEDANGARTLYCRALALRDLNRTSEAEQDLRQSIALLELSGSQFPHEIAIRQGLARSHINLGVLLRGTGRPKEAHAEYLAAIQLLTDLKQQHEENAEYQFELATALMNRSNLLFADVSRNDLGMSDLVNEAESNYRASIDLLRTLVAQYGNVPRYRRELANSLNGLGAVLSEKSQRAEAEQAWTDAVSEFKKLIARLPKVAEYHVLLAQTTYNLAYLRRGESQGTQLEELMREAVEAQGRAVELSPTNVLYLETLRSYEKTLCRVLVDRGNPIEAAITAERLAAHATGDSSSLYAAAKVLARCAVDLEQDSSLESTERMQLIQQYRAKALELLTVCRHLGVPIKAADFPGIDLVAEELIVEPVRTPAKAVCS